MKKGELPQLPDDPDPRKSRYSGYRLIPIPVWNRFEQLNTLSWK
jgi:hypothetical protein